MIAMRLQLVPLLALGLAVSAAGPASAQKRPPTPDEFFGEFKGKMIQDANQLDPWRQLAQNAARKTASDFASCPSPDAQALWDQLVDARHRTTSVLNEARAAIGQIAASRDRCVATLGPPARPGCEAAFATASAPFVDIGAVAQTTLEDFSVLANRLAPVGILSLAAWLRDRRGVALACYGASLFAKEQAAVVPLLFVLAFAGLMYALKRQVWADKH